MKSITEKLFELQDLKYRDFHSKLMPTVDKDLVIGVRVPVLRSFAKELAKEPEAMEFINTLPHHYYEENNLHGFLIDYMNLDYNETIDLVEEFLPYVDNWATCDCFSPKIFKKNRDKLYGKTIEWMKSDKEYTVRFGIVTQLNHFLDDDFKPEMLNIIGGIHREEYYINMAIAWYFSFALIKKYHETIGIFEKPVLDKWVHNKSIQKAVESYRIDKETKDYLRSLKI